MDIVIFGTGKMGTAIGKLLANKGNNIIYGSRDPGVTQDKYSDYENISVTTYPESATQSDVIIIATPWVNTLDLLNDVIVNITDAFKGKTIIDMTNPFSADVSFLTVGGNDSSGEKIASILNEANVVKAFNGVFADNLHEPIINGEKTQIFYCGDDDNSLSIVRDIIDSIGYEAIDCGELTNSRYLEAIAMLRIQLAFWEDRGSEIRFKLLGSDGVQ